MVLYVVAILAAVGVFFLWISSRQMRSAGLPAGRIIYSDHKEWGTLETALYDPTFNLTGKPDFIIDTTTGPIPVEVKSGRGKSVPYDSHIYQLAAYCLLIDQVLDARPEYGILHYSNQDIAIDYTADLEKNTIQIIREIHANSRKKSINRSHESSNRCQKCSYRSICDQSLVGR